MEAINVLYKGLTDFVRQRWERNFLWIVCLILIIMMSVTCSSPRTKPVATEFDPPINVEPILISQLGSEHFGNAIYRYGLNGPVIDASGNLILEFPLGIPAPASEVVASTSEKYSNGACSFDINSDGIDEMIAGRAATQDGTDLLWFEEVPGQKQWKQHLIANVKRMEGDAENGFHDIIPFETNISGKKVRGVVGLVSRKRLYLWYQIPGDQALPWKEHTIADLAKYAGHVQSGLVSGDLSGKGRQDLVCGNFWLECPADPSTDHWLVHRYSNWDQRDTPEFPGVPAWVKDVRFGGMNQLDIGDMDKDGKLDIIAADAEIPNARIGIFRQDMTNPMGLWKETLLDTTVYCPHSLVVTDANNDRLPDIIVGEMSAGGWMFPLNPNPHLYLYLNLGNMNFRKYILHTGWGVHMMQKTLLQPDGKVFVFAVDEIQSWYKDMTTNLVGWTISPRK